MNSKFKALVRGLDPEALDELRRSVASELEGRRQKTAIKLDDIHPLMSPAEKEQACQEISRVLRGE
ncbi:MAG: hypothetical protein ACRD30_07950 [Bryobacteraceae bacterium]